MEKSNAMANTSMNVSLPETLKEYVEERVAGGIYSNPSDFVRSLIRGGYAPPRPGAARGLAPRGHQIGCGRADDR